MHAALAHEFKFPPLPVQSEAEREYVEAVKARRVYALRSMYFLAIPGTPENDELLGDYCLLNSLCNRRGYLVKGACTIAKGPCPFAFIGNSLIGWEFLPSPARFWIADDFGCLNPVPVDGKLARVLRDAFNEQLLEHFNKIRTAVLPVNSAFMTRVNPEIGEAA